MTLITVVIPAFFKAKQPLPKGNGWQHLHMNEFSKLHPVPEAQNSSAEQDVVVVPVR